MVLFLCFEVLLIFKWWGSSKSFFVPTFSPLPMVLSFGVMSFFIFFLSTFYRSYPSFVFLLSVFIVSSWFFDLFNERVVGSILRSNINVFFWGFVLMIVSEILLFFSFFWAFFKFLNTLSLPFMIRSKGVPLLKTFLLLSSGVSITMFHRKLFFGNGGLGTLLYTLFLGIFFEGCQFWEYRNSLLSLYSFTYGTVFFMLTGLHGFHVLVGLICLIILYIKVNFCCVNSRSLISSECFIWYWHFVDIVWIFVYFFLYIFV